MTSEHNVESFPGKTVAKPSASVTVTTSDSESVIDVQRIYQKLHVDPKAPLGDIKSVEQMFRRATFASVILWLICVAVALNFSSRSEICDNPEIIGFERNVARAAFFISVTSVSLNIIPVIFSRGGKISSFVVAAFTVEAISMLTNALLGWGPRAVMVDQITGSRVFLFRWCEWIPLAGLMTLLAESADVSAASNGWAGPLVFAFFQSISTCTGAVFPFCSDIKSWAIVMGFAVVFFLPIFPRVIARYRVLQETPRGQTMIEREYYNRRRFAFSLMLVCSICWTVLVLLFVANASIHKFLPPDHFMRFPSLAIVLDTIADVVAKVFYTRVIVEAHLSVFSPDLRAARRLHELRQLMTVLWTASSDVIVVSTDQTNRSRLTMFSPSYLTLVGAASAGDEQVMPLKSTALVLETEGDIVEAAFYVNISACAILEDVSGSDELAIDQNAMIRLENKKNNTVEEAYRIMVETWRKSKETEPLRVMNISHCDGSTESICEMQSSRHSARTAVAMVRDVTERYKRFEAEGKVHTEMIARQRDMHTASRFTRHEVKNGLLAGLELCNKLNEAVNNLHKVLQATDLTNEALLNASQSITETGVHPGAVELDGTLRGVLNTVLAEVMAREVVHEVYQPKLEEVDVVELLSSDSGLSKQRFTLNINGGSIPNLMLEPQLLRHIYRNAVSNACKYGKPGGVVNTVVGFNAEENQLQLQVFNLPGDFHEALLAMGESAEEFVFAQGVRLQAHIKGTTEKHDSSGDGAWIMQKCASSMKGRCRIFFSAGSTEFRLTCPAMPVDPTSRPKFEDFVLPSNTWGIAVDDSKIQRKLMSRILDHVGIQDSRKVLLGANCEDVTGLDSTLLELMDQHPDDRFLVIVDENLDYNVHYNRQDGFYSGSLIMSQIIDRMPHAYVSRCLVLMRSANDSAADISLYTQRTHGYFPKAIMKRDRTREILAPMWAERFPEKKDENEVTTSPS